ncbi:MAG TPA: hypothetical protein VGE89_08215 [Bryobacteraceae bacterium]|jgi:hypothetical protein
MRNRVSLGGVERIQNSGRLWMFHAAPFLLGISLFAVNEAPVLSGYLAPPPGYVASFLVQQQDYLQYQTWIIAYQRTKGCLLPDYHAPWTTEPAMLNPYFWFVAHTAAVLGVDGLWIYHLFYLALHIAGGYALLFALRAFTYSQTQGRLALLVSFCSVPVASVLAVLTLPLSKSDPWIRLVWYAARVHGWYNNDGFVDGISGSPLVLFGSVSSVLCMGLLAKYLRTNLPKYLWWAGLVAAVSAFIHPFEIFVVMGAGGLALLMRRDRPWTQTIREVACLVIPGMAGMAPYVYLMLRHAWLRETGVQSRWIPPFSPPTLLLMLGFPAVLCVVSYVLPLRKRSVTDPLLSGWFGGVLVGLYVPWVPWSHHLLDGFFYATAMLLVRQAARWDFLRRLWMERPVAVRISIGVWVVLSVAAHGIYLADATAAGRVAGGGGSAVMSKTDQAVLAWLREHAGANDLVLSPRSSAGLFATVPMHSFASHWLYSITLLEQKRLSEAFYQGALDLSAADALLTGYGVRYAIIPNESPAQRYFSNQSPVIRIGSDAIYRMPNAAMRPFTPLHRSKIGE